MGNIRKNGIPLLAMVEFFRVEDSTKAIDALNNTFLFEDCIQLSITFCSKDKLEVKKNNDDFWDFTVAPRGPSGEKDVSVSKQPDGKSILHIKNMGLKTVESDIWNELGKYGLIVNVQLFASPDQAAIEFDSPAVALQVWNCIVDYDVQICGNVIDASFSKLKRLNNPSGKNNIISLSLKTNNPIYVNGFYEICKEYGEVARILISRFADGWMKAEIEYFDKEVAWKAKIHLNGACPFPGSSSIRASFTFANHLTVEYLTLDSWDYTFDPKGPDISEGYQSSRPEQRETDEENDINVHNSEEMDAMSVDVEITKELTLVAAEGTKEPTEGTKELTLVAAKGRKEMTSVAAEGTKESIPEDSEVFDKPAEPSKEQLRREIIRKLLKEKPEAPPQLSVNDSQCREPFNEKLHGLGACEGVILSDPMALRIFAEQLELSVFVSIAYHYPGLTKQLNASEDIDLITFKTKDKVFHLLPCFDPGLNGDIGRVLHEKNAGKMYFVCGKEKILDFFARKLQWNPLKVADAIEVANKNDVMKRFDVFEPRQYSAEDIKHKDCLILTAMTRSITHPKQFFCWKDSYVSGDMILSIMNLKRLGKESQVMDSNQLLLDSLFHHSLKAALIYNFVKKYLDIGDVQIWNLERPSQKTPPISDRPEDDQMDLMLHQEEPWNALQSDLRSLIDARLSSLEPGAYSKGHTPREMYEERWRRHASPEHAPKPQSLFTHRSPPRRTSSKRRDSERSRSPRR